MFAERFSLEWLNRKVTQRTYFGASMKFLIYKNQATKTNTKIGKEALEPFGRTSLR
jgi:hypothetical protein